MTLTRDDMLELLDAALAADYTRVRRAGSKIAQAVAKDDPDAAKAIRALIKKRGVPLRASGYAEALPVDAKSRLPLVEEQSWPTSPLFLDEVAGATLNAFVEDVKNIELLSSRGLSSRLSMLLSGAPGTGKTLLASHVAALLERPLYVVRLDAVVSSMLGDTAKNIRSVFDFVPTRQAVLFLDEMDAVAKVRDDRQELGELKRVVNTVIQSLDSVDDHAVVIGATNHPQLLDPAIWRRFPYKIDLPMPDLEVRTEMWSCFLADVSSDDARSLASISGGLSGAEIQNISLSSRRHSVLDSRSIDFGAIAWAAYWTGKGKSTLPARGGLSTSQKKKLANELVSSGLLSRSEVARIFGISRQAVSNYFKDQDDGD